MVHVLKCLEQAKHTKMLNQLKSASDSKQIRESALYKKCDPIAHCSSLVQGILAKHCITKLRYTSDLALSKREEISDYG